MAFELQNRTLIEYQIQAPEGMRFHLDVTKALVEYQLRDRVRFTDNGTVFTWLATNVIEADSHFENRVTKNLRPIVEVFKTKIQYFGIKHPVTDKWYNGRHVVDNSFVWGDEPLLMTEKMCEYILSVLAFNAFVPLDTEYTEVTYG